MEYARRGFPGRGRAYSPGPGAAAPALAPRVKVAGEDTIHKASCSAYTFLRTADFFHTAVSLSLPGVSLHKG